MTKSKNFKIITTTVAIAIIIAVSFLFKEKLPQVIISKKEKDKKLEPIDNSIIPDNYNLPDNTIKTAYK